MRVPQAMTKILVLHYSTYGHIEAFAETVARGARETADAQVDVKRCWPSSGLHRKGPLPPLVTA
jgi:hypothetical protein